MNQLKNDNEQGMHLRNPGDAKDGGTNNERNSNQESTLKRRGTDDRHLIDYHLQGLTLLHFEREMQGNTDEMRNKISEQLDIKHVVKIVNFLGH